MKNEVSSRGSLALKAQGRLYSPFNINSFL